MLAKIILASLLRRAIGFAGVGGMVGIDNEIMQAGGAVMTAASVAWSVVEKVREYRKTHPKEIK